MFISAAMDYQFLLLFDNQTVMVSFYFTGVTLSVDKFP